MNKIFDNKQEFTELYREAVMSISGKSVEAASDLDRFNALGAGEFRIEALEPGVVYVAAVVSAVFRACRLL